MPLVTIDSVATIGSALVIGFIVYKLLVYIMSRRSFKLPPGPVSLPLIGHIGELTGLTLFHHKDTYGDISYVHTCGTENIFLHSTDLVREAFQDCTFDNRPTFFFSAHILTTDVSFKSPSDAYWKKLRQVMHSSLKEFNKGVHGIDKIISDELDHLAGIYAKSNGAPIQLKDTIEPSTCNLLYILLVGIRFEYDHVMSRKPLEYLSSYNAFNTPFMDALLRRVPIIRYLPIPIGRRIQQTIKDQDMIYSYIFNPYKNVSADELRNKTGIAFHFLNEEKRHDVLDDECTKGAIMDLFGAAIATTTSSLYWFFLIMINYPDAQRRLQAEIDEVIQSGSDPKRRITLEDKPNMPYTEAAILELYRFSSNVPVSLAHTSSRTATVGGFTIPSKSYVFANFFRIHHDPELWDDPWTYNPDRFLDGGGNVLPSTHPNRRNLMAFSIGGRSCVGERFAKSRLFLYATRLLQRFEFRSDLDTPPSCDPRKANVGVVTMPNEYMVRAVERNQHE